MAVADEAIAIICVKKISQVEKNSTRSEVFVSQIGVKKGKLGEETDEKENYYVSVFSYVCHHDGCMWRK